MRRRTCWVLAGLLAVGASNEFSPAAAGPRKPLAPCPPGGPAFAKALRDWQRVDAAIVALHDGGDVAPANQLLLALLASRCFAPSEESTRDLPAPSALSLRTFWASGGREWTRSTLERQAEPSLARVVVVPPDVRPSLSVENPPDDVPRELLCPAGDTICGEETRGWAQQAEQDLRQAALAHGTTPGRPPLDGDRLAATCWDEAQRRGAGNRYEDWRSCVEARRPQVPALPLAAYRAPAAGWLVLRGARDSGHEFCEELRTYHLETGAGQVAESCVDDVRNASGVRDAEASEATRHLRVTSGRLRLDALRRATWMAVLSRRVGLAQVDAVHCPLPPGLVPRWPRGQRFGAVSGLPMWGRLHTTRVHWQWVAGRLLASGSLTWPPLGHPTGDEQAGRLLQAAEATFVAGCPPARVPAEVLTIDQGGAVSSAIEIQLGDALLHAAAEAPCRAPSAPSLDDGVPSPVRPRGTATVRCQSRGDGHSHGWLPGCGMPHGPRL